MVNLTLKDPINGIVEIGGPEKTCMDKLAKKYLDMKQDKREVIADPNALYFGTAINNQSLVPGDMPELVLSVTTIGYAFPVI